MDDSEDHLWEKCSKWLELINFPIPSANSGPTSEQEFQTFIQDGSFLCYLLHHIDPVSINLKNIRESCSHSRNQSIHNAQMFLTSCEEYYMVLTCDLFEASILYERQQLSSVFLALSSLTKTTRYVEAMQGTFDGDVPTLKLHEDFKDESDHHLYHLAGSYTTTTDSLVYSDTYLSGSQTEASMDESVYDSMMSQYLSTWGANTSMEGSLASSVYTTMSLSSSLENCVMNSMVVSSNPILTELLEKEACLIQLLTELLELYKNKLVSLSSDHFKPIFCDDLFESMKNLHEDMQKQVNDGLLASKDEIENVCEVFIRNKTRIASVYSKYFTQIDASLAKLQQLLEENPVLRDIFESIRKAAFEGSQCNSFDLCAVLHVPFQHVLRYRIFFDRLCEQIIPSAVPDSKNRLLENLEKTSEMTKDLNEHFNECKRNMETLKYLRSKFKEVSEPNDFEGEIKLFGKLLKEGEFSKVKVGKSFWGKTGVFVFQKAIAILIKTKHMVFKLEESEVLSNGKPGVITLKDKAGYRFVEIPIKNPDLFEEWKCLINQLVELGSLLEYRHHRCSLTSFVDEVILCTVCEKFLKGSYSQGYQCTKCKQCFDDVKCLQTSKPCQSSATVSSNNVPVLRNLFENRSYAEMKPEPSNLTNKYQRTVSTSIDLSGLSNLMLGGLDKLLDYPWFCPVKNRKSAYKICSLLPENTFLVRRSESDAHSAALMLKHRSKVQNIKITVKPESGVSWLTKVLTFPDIPSLIDHFKVNSLSICIPEVQTTLLFPFKEGLGKLKSALDSTQNQTLAFLKYRTEVTVDNVCCEFLPGEIVTIKSFESTVSGSVTVESLVERKNNSFKSQKFALPAEILEPI